jgi:Ni,Fe-hydrogenase III large subunit
MADRPDLRQTLAQLGPIEGILPWPRHRLDADAWRALRERLTGEDWTLVALFGDRDGDAPQVQLVLRDEVNGTLAAIRHDCQVAPEVPYGRFLGLGDLRPGAIRLERAIRDLFGIAVDEAVDDRLWLDHGKWPIRRPLVRYPDRRQPTALDYRFLPVEGHGIHQIPVGPVHAGIIEPGHFRFSANGETVVRLEELLGYVHKGIESLAVGKSIDDGAKLVGRVSGDATVAYALAYARAVEHAVAAAVPDRAVYLRAAMAELERIANHFGDFGAVCNDASFVFIQAHATLARERVLQAAEACFGHRLMMDRIVPGGVATDLSAEGAARLEALIVDLRSTVDYLFRIYENKPSLLDRTVSTGVTLSELIHRFGAGGHVGRAAGRTVDVRKSPGYPPYDDLEFDIPELTQGDVHARVEVRVEEIRQSCALIGQILERLPAGPTRVDVGDRPGEGFGMVESFRGDVLVYVRLDDEGRIERCHPRDPSWFQWPLLEACVEGNIVADFPLCNKSFNCSYSGHDL